MNNRSTLKHQNQAGYAVLFQHIRVNNKLRDLKKTNSAHIFTALLFALFVIAMLIGIMVGTSVYKNIAQASEQESAVRIAMTRTANQVRAFDAKNALAFSSGPEGPSLVLQENLETGSFETRLYLYQGNLVEEYALAGSLYTPERASIIAPTSTFSFDYNNGLLTITTDYGSTSLALRSLMALDGIYGGQVVSS